MGKLITKDAIIPSDCIIGAGSVVGKKKFVPNSVIEGVPASIVKSDITWSVETICKYGEPVK